ncbi:MULTISPECIES: ATP-grasp ribosomal peptide maturase [unclassified Streptomyces]|uniref:ATP-grasp ribosomal peptide maturase n=1 Tax=unclassified Streptomyces TaxID=2593676 RepID=UPI002ED1BBF8|nr:ATP-grasp ribosomal peptide maturase [Streptomyces sp. NBC_00891]WSY10116.1 ATP-grasp ribosomal peptide maturase [Streptomyces sp. NBC_00890]WSZ11750.1 ATP-grasp ribosomal peptide maturase [Streptomyces sp. NBC_00869]WSZ27844.1 ATP-grasp ribosomal peptide maturase [Streptomyces sp. NBC_00870]
MAAPVLIIAAADDWPTDRVVTELRRHGAEVFRMDTADFPQWLSLAGRIDQEVAWTGGLSTEHRTVDLAQVGAVYYRAPGSFRFPDGLSGPEKRFAASQARSGLGGILSSLKCRWMNHPSSMARAEYKPVQLAEARGCGLRVPPTLITNRPQDVLDFADAVGDLVCKPVASPVLIEDGLLKSVYTKRLTRDDLRDLRGIDTTAHLFQGWVPKDYEVRLTVIGDRMFAASIRAGSAAGYEDWRSDYGSLTYSTTSVPTPVADGMRRLMRRLGLRYGAADFVVGPGDEWTFLEVNPCGQWDWIQGATGLPIAEAIAHDLEGAT